MALTSLPTELLNGIIEQTLPEGFENLAVTCKKLHTLCAPFIEHHNKLRSHFYNFSYYERFDKSFNVHTAFDLISRIATEPIVARYIRHADFEADSQRLSWRCFDLAHPDASKANIVRLFANSPYLKQAGLSWKEFYTEIEEDLEARRVSMHAAAFLLTLLPNIKTLQLPRFWKPLDATDRLIDAVAHKARQPQLPFDTPGLAQVTKIGPFAKVYSVDHFDLDWASPFLALPRVRDFRSCSCVKWTSGNLIITPNAPPRIFAETLAKVELESCCIDEEGIARFLENTPRLKTFSYSHSTKTNDEQQDWNIGKFVTAIEHKVGTHLEQLSIVIRTLRDSITPNKVSMREFQRLQRLCFPMELALGHIAAVTSQVQQHCFSDNSLGQNEGQSESLLEALVPDPVSQLSLLSRGTGSHREALDAMFHHLITRRFSHLRSLNGIEIDVRGDVCEANEDHCARLRMEAEKVGVVLRALPWDESKMAWEEE